MRKLVTLRKISDLKPLPNSDFLQLAHVDGWKTIVKKDAFSVGDYGLYFEIDSLLPMDDPRFEFINFTKKMLNVEYRFVKTIKLRGNVSQGLFIGLDDFPEIKEMVNDEPEKFKDHDFSEQLNVIKYEEEDDLAMDDEYISDFPSYVRATGEERIQNLFDDYSVRYKDVLFYPTLKMDGSSATIGFVTNPTYFLGSSERTKDLTEQIWVASHGKVLKEEARGKENGFHKVFNRLGLKEKIKDWCVKHGKQIAIQGELLGPKIQGNYENYTEHTFRAFYVFFIDEYRRATYSEFKAICEELDLPMIREYEPFKVFEKFDNVEDLLAFADGESENGVLREGLVFKSDTLNVYGEPVSFKVISNKYLLKKK